MENSKQPITPTLIRQVGIDDFKPNNPFKKDYPEHTFMTSGLTKREHFASQNLQGLLANERNNDNTVKFLVELSIKAADELLKQLENSKS